MKPDELHKGDFIQRKGARDDEWWIVEYACPEYVVVKLVERVSAEELENWQKVHSYGSMTR